MKATITFSNNVAAELSGLDNAFHAEKVANIMACDLSAKCGVAVHPRTIQMDENNFVCLPYPEFNMMGVNVERSFTIGN